MTSFTTHFSRYAVANILAIAAGVVTFPVTTRVLSASEFGLLGYWEVWILFGTAMAKMGSGDMILRFHPSIGKRSAQLRYGTNNFIAPLALSSAIALLFLLVTVALAGLHLIQHGDVAAIASALIVVQISHTFCLNLIAAKELSGTVSLITVGLRWSVGLLTIFAMMLPNPSALSVLIARFIPSLVLAAWLVYWVGANQLFDLRLLSTNLIRQAYKYSLPLAFREISNIVLVLGNRIIIDRVLKSDALLGIYTIGFSLATYFEQILGSALSAAITPSITRAYEEGGAPAAAALKHKVLPPVFYACCAGVALLLPLSEEIVVFVSGVGKAAAARVFQIAGISYFIQSVLSLMAMGLLLEKRSLMLLRISALSAAANIILGMAMTKIFGIIGAVTSTCLCQIGLQVGALWACNPELRCFPSAKMALKGALFGSVLSSCVFFLTNVVGLRGTALFSSAIMTFILIFLIPVIFIEPTFRNFTSNMWRRIFHPHITWL